MFKFNLRDLIWLTIVAALIVVIFVNMFAFRQKKRELNEQLVESKLQAEQLQARLQVTEQRVQSLQQTITKAFADANPDKSDQLD